MMSNPFDEDDDSQASSSRSSSPILFPSLSLSVFGSMIGTAAAFRLFLEIRFDEKYGVWRIVFWAGQIVQDIQRCSFPDQGSNLGLAI